MEMRPNRQRGASRVLASSGPRFAHHPFMVSTLDWTELLLPISRAQYLVTCPADEIARFAEEMPESTGAVARVVQGEWSATKKDAVWEIAQAFEFPKSADGSRN